MSREESKYFLYSYANHVFVFSSQTILLSESKLIYSTIELVIKTTCNSYFHKGFKSSFNRMNVISINKETYKLLKLLYR